MWGKDLVQVSREKTQHTYTLSNIRISVIKYQDFYLVKKKKKKGTACNFHLSFYRLPNKQTNDRIYSCSLHRKQNFPRKKEKENNGLGDVEK